MPSGHKANRYSISIRNDDITQVPRKWCFMGYLDPTWYIIDDRRTNNDVTTDEFIENNRTLTFAIHGNATYYTAYSIIATEVHGGSGLSIQDMKIYCFDSVNNDIIKFNSSTNKYEPSSQYPSGGFAGQISTLKYGESSPSWGWGSPFDYGPIPVKMVSGYTGVSAGNPYLHVFYDSGSTFDHYFWLEDDACSDIGNFYEFIDAMRANNKTFMAMCNWDREKIFIGTIHTSVVTHPTSWLGVAWRVASGSYVKSSTSPFYDDCTVHLRFSW